MLTAWWLPSTDQVKNRKFDNEFIKRELGIELFSGIAEKTTQLNRAIVGKPALIFTDSSVESMEALKEFPNRSVILFVLSDETYRFRFNFRIIANPKVKVIIRNYPYSQFLNLIFSIPFAFLKLIRLIKGRKLLGLLPKAILSGTYMLITQTSLKIMAIVARKSVLNLPIGYDSAFSRNYARHFGLGENDSLMQNAIPRYKYFENRKSIAKSKLIVFMGQRGSLDRQLIIYEAIDEIEIEVRLNDRFEDGRSNEKQRQYFDLLLCSQFTLCPAGNYSALTFRYYEALLVQTVPLMDSFIFSDPLFRSPRGLSWTLFRRRVRHGMNLQLLYSSFIVFCKEALDHEFRELMRVREIIRN